MSKNIKEIVTEFLITNRYDGLCNEYGCGCWCKVREQMGDDDNLMHCEENRADCVAGYKKIATEKDTETIDCEVGDVIIVEEV